MGTGTTGELGRAWVGAWVVPGIGAWVVHGRCMALVYGWCMALMHGCVDDGGTWMVGWVVGLVRLDLGIGVCFWMRYVVTSLVFGCPMKWDRE